MRSVVEINFALFGKEKVLKESEVGQSPDPIIFLPYQQPPRYFDKQFRIVQ